MFHERKVHPNRVDLGLDESLDQSILIVSDKRYGINLEAISFQ